MYLPTQLYPEPCTPSPDHDHERAYLLPNNIGTSLPADPHLMHLSSIDIDPVADAVRRLLRPGIFRVGDGQFPGEDEMCRQAGVRMRRVVCVTT